MSGNWKQYVLCMEDIVFICRLCAMLGQKLATQTLCSSFNLGSACSKSCIQNLLIHFQYIFLFLFQKLDKKREGCLYQTYLARPDF